MGKVFKPVFSTVATPVVMVRGLVLFPGMILNFDIGRPKSKEALIKAMNTDQTIFVVTQKDINEDEPDYNEGGIYKDGVFAKIKQVSGLNDGVVKVLVEGQSRGKIESILQTQPCLIAAILPSEEIKSKFDSEGMALLRTVKNIFSQYVRLMPKIAPDIINEIETCNDPYMLADFIASNIDFDYRIKQKILAEEDVIKRLDIIMNVLVKELEILSIEENLNFKLMNSIETGKREYYLREQKKVIEKELGEDDIKNDTKELLDKINRANLPDQVRVQLIGECNKLTKMQFGAQEAGVIYNYIDLCIALPWNERTYKNIDLKNAERILNRDHYGMDEVKSRILDALAVKKLSRNRNGQILCLIGPPGVGKTSIAKSIAEATGRRYQRISLGGVCDEADIRGHRKTYVGAMPGRIISAIRKAGSKNTLILLDEIDKMRKDMNGDPVSALLEVLDEEQNNSFYDHYVDMPFDLSDIFFITTANNKEDIPYPLLDRIEVINLSSYTREEKFFIAKKHLIPKQLKKHGIDKSQFNISDGALKELIDGYTYEAGVRALERMVACILRKSVRSLVYQQNGAISVTIKNLEEILGSKKYRFENLHKEDMVGVCNGLAWTSLGGEKIFVEAAVMCGSGKIELTGCLGDIMKESARTALSYVRSSTEKFNLPCDFYDKVDIHIHVPNGAVPKDGPSAGVPIAIAVISALMGIPIKKEVSMTGEITLRGHILPVGGVKEKVMAAYRANTHTVILPEENRADVSGIDDIIKKKMKLIFVSNIADVLANALVLKNGITDLKVNESYVNKIIKKL